MNTERNVHTPSRWAQITMVLIVIASTGAVIYQIFNTL
jgi:hypothetical protein